MSGVEGKQSVTGQSGKTWEIDAKGIRKGDEGFVMIECRCYPNDRVTQEEVAGLAYRIWNSGAAGGLVVSPHDLQAGAKLVAAHEGIVEIQMAPVSTTTDYMVKFSTRFSSGVRQVRRTAASRARVGSAPPGHHLRGSARVQLENLESWNPGGPCSTSSG